MNNIKNLGNTKPSIITKIKVEKCLRKILEAQNYILNNKQGLQVLGPDIKAVKNNEATYVEIIGLAKSGLEKAGDFYEAFFRSFLWLNEEDCKYCAIAMPAVLRRNIDIRARLYKEAWKRLANAFPEFEIWLVNIEKETYQKTSWIAWLK